VNIACDLFHRLSEGRFIFSHANAVEFSEKNQVWSFYK